MSGFAFRYSMRITLFQFFNNEIKGQTRSIMSRLRFINASSNGTILSYFGRDTYRMVQFWGTADYIKLHKRTMIVHKYWHTTLNLNVVRTVDHSIYSGTRWSRTRALPSESDLSSVQVIEFHYALATYFLCIGLVKSQLLYRYEVIFIWK